MFANLVYRITGKPDPASIVEQLDFGPAVWKRLDEHREVVEAIEEHTKLFRDHPWHISHMATQDDYLMRLFHIVNGRWPDDDTKEPFSGRFIRQRPAILGPCTLPEYPR